MWYNSFYPNYILFINRVIKENIMANLGKVQAIKDGKFYVKRNNIPSKNKSKQKETNKKFFYVRKDKTNNKLRTIRDIIDFPIRIITALFLSKLKVGDIVYLHDTIVPAKSNSASAKMDILLDTNEILTINNIQGEVKLDASLSEATPENEELALNNDVINTGPNPIANTQSNTETTKTEDTEEDTINDNGAFVGKFDQRDNKEAHLSANYDEQSALDLEETSAQNNENEILADLVNANSEDEAPMLPNKDSSDKSDPSNSSLPKLKISGSSVSEDTDGVTGKTVLGQVTLELDKAFDEDITVRARNEVTGKEQDVIIVKGQTKVIANVETSRVDDIYKQGDTSESISIVKVSNPNVETISSKTDIIISDDADKVNANITQDTSIKNM